MSQAPLQEGVFYAILATSQTKVMLCKARIYDPDTLQYDVEVEAPSISDAYTIIERREGVERKYIGTISVIDESSGGGSIDVGDMGGYLALGAIVFGLWLVIEYWWIVIPVAVIGGIGWFLKD